MRHQMSAACGAREFSQAGWYDGRVSRGETEGLIARHFAIGELRRKLEGAGLRDVRIVPYGQDAELLPLPRRFRQPITDRLPLGLKDRTLRRFGHQLGPTA
jgi:hypothetical protein